MVVSIDYDRKIMSNVMVAEGLLNLLSPALQKKYNKPGVSVSILSEIVTASAKKTMCNNSDGMDNIDGSETKFATIVKGTLNIRADIANLKTKTGDLHIILADPEYLTSKKLFRFFTFPKNVWKNKIPGDKFTFSFSDPSKYKWYLKYEVTQTAFFGR